MVAADDIASEIVTEGIMGEFGVAGEDAVQLDSRQRLLIGQTNPERGSGCGVPSGRPRRRGACRARPHLLRQQSHQIAAIVILAKEPRPCL